MKYKTEEPCAVCGATGINDAHHVKTRGASGGDEPFNLIPLCRFHHAFVHSTGRTYMANRFPGFKKWLLDNNWYFNEDMGRWCRDKE